ncbi:BglII/BstYI family type II restriction endonuclease [Roseateles sp. LKC17W]|jgi:hypothetical protein|uniref:BglII/BstYI family type II restriction endonuclease n=1 Tax=Pelomonas margarita TaxID=3299031 RepID=A0ABW7FGS8_9BURK
MKIKNFVGNKSGLACLQQPKFEAGLIDITSACSIGASIGKTGDITKSITKTLRSLAGWNKTEWKDFHPFVQSLGNKKSFAIDAFHPGSGIAVEVELSNQTAFSHDLMKLDAAYKFNKCSLGVAVALSDSLRMSLSGKTVGYLTFGKACTWLQVVGETISVPLLVVELG